MSVYAVLDGDREGGEQTASNRGWGDLVDWVETLDLGTYWQLAHLADYGWSQQLAKLDRQLTAALDTEPPGDAATRAVAETLLGVVRARGTAEVLTISSGLAVQADGELANA